MIKEKNVSSNDFKLRRTFDKVTKPQEKAPSKITQEFLDQNKIKFLNK